MNTRIYTRWLGALLAPIVVVVASTLLAGLYYKGTQSGTPGLFALAYRFPILTRFVQVALLREVLPLYAVIGLLGWAQTALLGSLVLGKGWRDAWNGKVAFLSTLGGLLLIHASLWWRVPTTMWVIPGLKLLPMGLALILVTAVGVGFLRWTLPRGAAAWGLTLGSLFGWCLLAQLPFWLQTTPRTPQGAGTRPTEMLMVAIDGLRPDIAYEEGLSAFQGQHAVQAFTPIPATRMLYSLLWGGDPLRFTSAHIMPDVEEYEHKARYHTLQAAKDHGKKVRFYIDDGGTIGLSQRGESFDEIGMPASGWENFVGSNLAVHLPLYASWLEVLRVFPTTNPWAYLDSGLRTALERGRGGDWVFFHSCLTHQPIFLDRQELSRIPTWWQVPAARMEPIPTVASVTGPKVTTWDERGNPALAYRIRVRSLIESWGPIWNALAKDPQYGKATRLFISDHGERFKHATETVQVQGTHGYDLNPWELKVPMILQDGSNRSGRFSSPVGLLGLRAAMNALAVEGTRPTLESMATTPVLARLNLLRMIGDQQGDEFLTFDPLNIIQSSYIGPDGIWAMKYEKPAKERGENAAVAVWEDGGLATYRPLKLGGALRTLYRDYSWVKDEQVDESIYRKKKKMVEGSLAAMSYGE